jgi:uncharacterized membrane protein YbhN (UPF0104 family)
VAGIAPAVMLGALALEAASLACFSGLTVSLLGRARRPRFGTLLRIDVTVYGLSRVLPAAAATGGALRLRLLTAAGVTHPDAVFLATIEGTGSALLLYTMLGVALVVSLPVHGVDPRQILIAAVGIALVAAAFALLVAVARDGTGLRRMIGSLARWVPGMNADHAAEALGRTPGGVGVVEGVLIPSLVAAGVPAHLALVGVLGWRLVNYWLPIPVGGLMWLTLRHHAVP